MSSKSVELRKCQEVFGDLIDAMLGILADYSNKQLRIKMWHLLLGDLMISAIDQAEPHSMIVDLINKLISKYDVPQSLHGYFDASKLLYALENVIDTAKSLKSITREKSKLNLWCVILQSFLQQNLDKIETFHKQKYLFEKLVINIIFELDSESQGTFESCRLHDIDKTLKMNAVKLLSQLATNETSLGMITTILKGGT